MQAYFDTSALVKLLVEEPGSDVAEELWRRARTVLSGRLTYPEARAAVSAAHRAGRLDGRELRAAARTIDALFAQLRVVGVDDALARSAGDLAEEHGLRGYDAVHLAAALSAASERLVVVTWDRTLAAAAVASGCAVAPAPAE